VLRHDKETWPVPNKDESLDWILLAPSHGHVMKDTFALAADQIVMLTLYQQLITLK
jgi:hypothetical protein